MVVGPLHTFRRIGAGRRPNRRAMAARGLRAVRRHFLAERRALAALAAGGLRRRHRGLFRASARAFGRCRRDRSPWRVAALRCPSQSARPIPRLHGAPRGDGGAVARLRACQASRSDACRCARAVAQDRARSRSMGASNRVQAHGKGVRVVLDAADAPTFARGDAPAHGARLDPRGERRARARATGSASTAVLMPPPGPAAPGGYDFGRAAFFDRIGAVGFAYGRAQAIAPPRAPTLVERDADGRRAPALAHDASASTPCCPAARAAIAAALITGERGVDLRRRRGGAARRRARACALDRGAAPGAGRARACSGSCARCWRRSRRSRSTQPIKKWAAVAALGGATFYLIISGAATPATRAYIMLAMMLAAILFDRPALSMRSVALAARDHPAAAPGEHHRARLPDVVRGGGRPHRGRGVGAGAPRRAGAARPRAASPASGAMCAASRSRASSAVSRPRPIAMFHFDRATHYAVLGNLLAMPVMGFVTMPAAAIAVMAMPFGLEAWPLQAHGFRHRGHAERGRISSPGLPGATSAVPAWPVSALVLIVASADCGSRCGGGDGAGSASCRSLAGVAVALTGARPGSLVARDGATVAVRGDDGVLRLVRKARDAYSAGEWLKRDGDARLSAEAVAGRGRWRALRRLWLHREGEGRCAARRHRAHRCAGGGLRERDDRGERGTGATALHRAAAGHRPLRRRARRRLRDLAGGDRA